MLLKMKMVQPSARVPRYATDGSACIDFSVRDGFTHHICRGTPQMIGSGWAVEVPKGYVMLLFSRSGHGAKNGVRLSNCVGVIDSDYRGEVMGSITNDGDKPLDLKGGDNFMQAMVVEIPRMELMIVSELSTTARGEGGFGSTGMAGSVTPASRPITDEN